MAVLAYIAIAVASAVFGYMIRFRRRYEFIPGYNNMSREEQKNFNIESFAKLLSTYFFALTGFMAVGAVFIGFQLPWLALVAILLPSLMLPYVFYKARKFGRSSQPTRPSSRHS